ncbi:MAG: YbhB/YbcL family Raf kinase inhibitor-like protein [Caldisphaeraceae archaeon]|nr:YbhB/YbcL family Raf kinase inhibitor-like protein [Caldisphaeraceae archaeon]MEB3691895.1 YbhB/YbcL family Raf kinase inhibitor-like protein [Caldisphaeraceae archaeon]MEB3797343.1 YbhB/YbcL family Raf kinase inhibitor-like protein [Caldisphaeraceae archaeon]
MPKEYVLREGKEFLLKSSSFENGGIIPKKYTCEGEDINPQLSWEGVEGAKSYALIMYDPDAPVGTFIHWVLYNIPPNKKNIEEGVATREHVEGIGRHGKNDFGKFEYAGPCPPRGHGQHRYYFALHALNVEELGIKGKVDASKLLNAIKGKVIGYGILMGKFSR